MTDITNMNQQIRQDGVFESGVERRNQLSRHVGYETNLNKTSVQLKDSLLLQTYANAGLIFPKLIQLQYFIEYSAYSSFSFEAFYCTICFYYIVRNQYLGL